jgi:hypothetical protein
MLMRSTSAEGEGPCASGFSCSVAWKCRTLVWPGRLRSTAVTDGTLGDPTGATAEHGKRKYEAMLTMAAQSLAEIARFDPHPPR